MGTCLIEDISVEDNVGTVGFCAVYLDERCCHRHNDGCFHTGKFCGIGNALGMVSGRCGDQTAGTLFR